MSLHPHGGTSYNHTDFFLGGGCGFVTCHSGERGRRWSYHGVDFGINTE